MKNQVKVFITITVILLLTVTGGFSRSATTFGADRAFSLEGSYSLRDKLGFSGEYQLNRYSMGLSYEQERWRARAGMRLFPSLKVSAGFDFTQDSYLAGIDHQWKIGDNLAITTEATGFWPRNFQSREASCEYDTRLTIGLGEDSSVAPGLRGTYLSGSGHEPEFYLLFDFNWYFSNDLQLKIEPLILVEGGFNHQTTLTKRFDTGWKTGIFFGQPKDEQWEIGAFVSY